MVFLTETTGLIAALLTTCSFIPQVYRSMKFRATNDLSWGMLVISLMSATFWLLYGVHIKDSIIVFSNAIMGLLQLNLIVLKIRHA